MVQVTVERSLAHEDADLIPLEAQRRARGALANERRDGIVAVPHRVVERRVVEQVVGTRVGLFHMPMHSLVFF